MTEKPAALPAKRKLPPWPDDFLKLAEYRARCYVNGTVKNPKNEKIEPASGKWSAQFKSDPRVIESERDGWGKELRSAMILHCRLRIMEGRDLGCADDLMPVRPEWWRGVRENAARFRRAAEWQEKNLISHFQLGRAANKIISGLEEKKAALPRVDRDAWNARYNRD
jgi:hypothetical protein